MNYKNNAYINIYCINLYKYIDIDLLLMEHKIVFISGHYPKGTFYANRTRMSIEKYTKLHGYNFYYSEEVPDDTSTHILHFHRSLIIQRAVLVFPDAEWFVWLDSDVYVNNYDMKVEDQINLTDENILYHLFHENNWGLFPINTGVKFVNKKALQYEEMVWSLRNTYPWNTFPYEQKTIYEHILPQIPNQYIIHDPYILNCIIRAYPDKVANALFVHMCGTSEEDRNKIMENILI